MLIVKKISFLLLWFSQLVIYKCIAQSQPILGHYSLSAFENKVYITWSIKAGSTCNGIQIYHSTDSINFSQIGEISGICGSTNFEQPYDFIDNNPAMNKTNYYKLGLGGGFSQVLSVDIIGIENNGYQIRPHPIQTDSKIYFNNKSKQEYVLIIHNYRGIAILRLTSREDFFDLATSHLLSGFYLFTISQSEGLPLVRGKLLIQH